MAQPATTNESVFALGGSFAASKVKIHKTGKAVYASGRNGLRKVATMRTANHTTGFSSSRSVRLPTRNVAATATAVYAQPTILDAAKPMPGTPNSFSLNTRPGTE